VIGGSLALVWETPAAELAVPLVVGVAAYALLWPFARVKESTRIMAALSAATGWLILLGGSTGPLSACRVADGRPSSTADSFMHALLTGDIAGVHHVDTTAVRPFESMIARIPPARRPHAVVPRRRDVSDGRLCDALRSTSNVDRCYEYRMGRKATSGSLWVGVSCHVRRWRVDFAA